MLTTTARLTRCCISLTELHLAQAWCQAELQLRESNIAAWEALFGDFDEDGNNEISMQEFRSAFKRSFISVGRCIVPPPKQWARPHETPEWSQQSPANGDRAYN